MLRNTYSMIGNAVATIPEGMVNGPEMVLPRKSVLKGGGLVDNMLGPRFYLLGSAVSNLPSTSVPRLPCGQFANMATRICSCNS